MPSSLNIRFLPEIISAKVRHRMAQQNHPISFFSLPIINATTSSPGFVISRITNDINLAKKTRCVVLVKERGTVTASVFRERSDAPGSWSRDIYVRTGKAWKLKKKDSKKYKTPPDPRPNAITTEINGVECWTMHQPTDVDIMMLRELISQSPLQRKAASIVAHSVIR